jgi:hypothetical protein
MLVKHFSQVLKTWWIGSLWVLVLLVEPLLMQKLTEPTGVISELRLIICVAGILSGVMLLALNWSMLKINAWIWSLIVVESLVVFMHVTGTVEVQVYLLAVCGLLGFSWLMAE